MFQSKQITLEVTPEWNLEGCAAVSSGSSICRDLKVWEYDRLVFCHVLICIYVNNVIFSGVYGG